ncbi:MULTISPECIES: hypothetical protein [unclassified Mesorhizobium]|uniref:hypothetical protein n=1 Tax=unclassified Mesorhizobium TaxID=325217 RepID=UPI0003CEB443|nr:MULTISPECIES: hypothetical protein [unclassified Mesorhizobium]ESX27629.1 hypothetical protein X765_20680 [Mesorhizobium sp. LSHC440B00]ESX30156.1 hypothetical protein X764_31210 [Mesorhizobium sp. LSHC440A00]ESX37792.1 hypothetical protein X763_13595 [Mesorhizobium sp. LSHC432A00]WJI57245.1 hypothetical protein NLY33_00290 [Mesorhizobium sp. C432A]
MAKAPISNESGEDKHFRPKLMSAKELSFDLETVLDVMKVIIDGGLEAEFKERASGKRKIKAKRNVVNFVKKFLADHHNARLDQPEMATFREAVRVNAESPRCHARRGR